MPWGSCKQGTTMEIAVFSAVSRAERQRNLITGIRKVRCKPKKKPSKTVPQIVLRGNSYMLTSIIPPSGNAYLWVITVVLSNIYHCS